MYESRRQALLSRAKFAHRMVVHFALAAALLAVSLGLGMTGYVAFEKLSWMDAFLNSAMLLGGMGPVNAPQTEAGKFFAGVYALYAGLVFVVSAALLFTPVLHRVMHKLHWSDKT